jgi:hypothetical protein
VSVMKTSDLLFEREQEMLDRFRMFGPDVVIILQRVFQRYGHFKPLLTHMKLVADGDLLEQEDTLHRIITRYGVPTFIEAVEIGTNPAQLMRKAFETPMEEYVNNPERGGGSSGRLRVANRPNQFTSSFETSSAAAPKMPSSPSALAQVEARSSSTPTGTYRLQMSAERSRTEGSGDAVANIPGTPHFVERRKNPDRRKNSPGRRQMLIFGFPNDRRESGCRRKAQRRANG